MNNKIQSGISYKKQDNQVHFCGLKDKAYSGLKWLAEAQNLNSTLCNAAIVTALATTLRPAAILAMPGAKKEDKQYSAAKSITTGIVGLLFALALYKPLEHSLAKLSGKLTKLAKLKSMGDKANLDKVTSKVIDKFPFHHESKEFEILSYLLTKGSMFIIGPIQAFCMINTIPHAVRRIFPKSTDKAKTQQPGQNIVYRDYMIHYAATLRGAVNENK